MIITHFFVFFLHILPEEKLLAIEASLAEEARFRLAQEEALRAAERHLQETKARGAGKPGKPGWWPWGAEAINRGWIWMEFRRRVLDGFEARKGSLEQEKWEFEQ